MAINRGKQFEDIIKSAFEQVEDVSIDRLHDQTTGYYGSKNICDFIVYKYPYQYYIECKSVHGNTLPLSNITDNQYNGMLEKSEIAGVKAGVICWFVDKDATFFIPITAIEIMKEDLKRKSINIKDCYENDTFIEIPGKKKRVFFDYNMNKFFEEVCR